MKDGLFSAHGLAAVNASLNGLAGILLVVGFFLVKAGRIEAHKRTMLAAFGVSCVFLVSYLTRKFAFGDQKFGGEGNIRWLYFPMLLTHVLLAAAVPPLAIVSIRRGLRGDVEGHRRLVKWTFPIWLYVSVTGVLVYFMLYRWYPAV